MINVGNYILYKNHYPLKKVKKTDNVTTNFRKSPEYSLYNLPFNGIFVNKNKGGDNPLPDNVHTIRMHRYDQSDRWAADLLKLTYKTSEDIKNNLSFNLLIKKLRFNLLGLKKKYKIVYYGTVSGLTEIDGFSRGREYLERYLKKFNEKKDRYGAFSPKSNEEYKDANVCTIKNYAKDKIIITNGTIFDHGVSNLKFIKEEYEKLKSNENPTIDDINKSVATIHWLIDQESPFKNINGITANILTKAIYHSYGVKVTAFKKGVSPEFEAYYSDLDDYIKNYPNFFEKPPEF